MSKLRKNGGLGLPRSSLALFMRSAKINVNEAPLKDIVNALRQTWHLLLVLRDEFYWQPVTKQRYTACFTARNDPWGYEAKKSESEKYQAAFELLADARNGAWFARGWEIGCAEGVFTARLARICAHLLAVDYIPLALDRARVRCQAFSNIFFSEWDLNSDAAPDPFDLIVIMDVLGSLGGWRDIRRARDKIVGALEAGGHLLYCDCLGELDRRRIQNSWWGRLMLRGPRNIHRFVASHPALVEIASRETAMHLVTVFQKTK